MNSMPAERREIVIKVRPGNVAAVMVTVAVVSAGGTILTRAFTDLIKSATRKLERKSQSRLTWSQATNGTTSLKEEDRKVKAQFKGKITPAAVEIIKMRLRSGYTVQEISMSLGFAEKDLLELFAQAGKEKGGEKP
jgi:hypothetical protein